MIGEQMKMGGGEANNRGGETNEGKSDQFAALTEMPDFYKRERADAEMTEGESVLTGEEAKANYERVVRNTEYWHGTGRFQYDENGEVVDILRGILADGGLIPQNPDNYNAAKRGQLSTSLGKSRETSLKYADIHNSDPTAVERNLGMEEWIQGPLQDTIDVMNFNMAKRAVQEAEKRSNREPTEEEKGHIAQEALQTQMQKVTEQRPWASHFRKNAGMERVAKTFRQGSDIESDYPILLGIREIPGAEPLAAMPWHEARVEGGVELSNLTHIEVPAERIEETRAILAEYGVNLPVVAIETGEAVAAEHPEEISEDERNAIEQARKWKAKNQAPEMAKHDGEEQPQMSGEEAARQAKSKRRLKD